MKVLDVAFSPISLSWCKARKAEGWEGLIQNLWTGGYAGNDGLKSVARNNLTNAKAAGMKIAAYANASPPDWWSIDIQIKEIKANAGSMWDQLENIAIDVEIPKITLARVYELAGALTTLGKTVNVLYTARWVWTGHMGNREDAAWRRWKLWSAHYDWNPDIDFAGSPYGPWTLADVVGEQYQGTTNLGGVSVDLNIFLDNVKGGLFDMASWTPGQEARIAKIEKG